MQGTTTPSTEIMSCGRRWRETTVLEHSTGYEQYFEGRSLGNSSKLILDIPESSPKFCNVCLPQFHSLCTPPPPPVTFSLSLCIPPLFARSLLVILALLAPLRYDQPAIAAPRTACLFRPSQTITLTYINYTITELKQRIQ